MARYAIYAYESVYQGLHGYEERMIFEGTLHGAEEYGEYLSRQVMDSINCYYDDYESEAADLGYDSSECEEYIDE